MDIENITGLKVREIADACSISVQAVYKWGKTGKVPGEHCRTIERISNGKATRYSLRPDIFGTSADGECHETKAAA